MSDTQPASSPPITDKGEGKRKRRPRVVRDEDLADGEQKPTSPSTSTTSPSEGSKPPALTDDATITPAQPRAPKSTYVRPEVTKKEKMTPEELDAMMARMKLKNEQLKQQRERIEADEDAFNNQLQQDRESQAKARAAQRAKEAAQRKLQEDINIERSENAKRKLAGKGTREWDSEKKDKKPQRERPDGKGRGYQITSDSIWGDKAADTKKKGGGKKDSSAWGAKSNSDSGWEATPNPDADWGGAPNPDADWGGAPNPDADWAAPASTDSKAEKPKEDKKAEPAPEAEAGLAALWDAPSSRDTW